MGIYVKSNLSASVLHAESLPNCFEFLALKIHHGTDPLTVVGIYRLPTAESHATDTLVHLLSKYFDDELLVLGDLNLNWLSDASLQLKNHLCSTNLTQLITVPTRPNTDDISKSTLIDLILTNKPSKYTSGVFELGVSDHCPIVCVRDVRVKKSASKVVSKRNFKRFDSEEFLGELDGCDWSHLGLIEDCADALDSFALAFNHVVDKHAPYKTTRIKDRSVPWFTHELSALFNDRNCAWRRARRSGTPQHWLSFRQLRNQCTAAVRRAKSEYFLNLVTTSYSNPAKFWGAINLTKSRSSNAMPLSIKLNDCVLSDPTDIRRAFNNHFSEAGHLFDLLYPGLPSSVASRASLSVDRVPQFSFRPFSSLEVRRVLESIKPNSSTGLDHLDPFFLKLAAPIISIPLAYIYNLSISSGSFPLVWKSAQVIPLHKGGIGTLWITIDRSPHSHACLKCLRP